MDPEIQQNPRDLLGHIKESELRELIRLLEAARKSCLSTQAPVSCTGETGQDGSCAIVPETVSRK